MQTNQHCIQPVLKLRCSTRKTTHIYKRYAGKSWESKNIKGKVVPLHAMKERGEMAEFLTSALDGASGQFHTAAVAPSWEETPAMAE